MVNRMKKTTCNSIKIEISFGEIFEKKMITGFL